MFWPTYIARPRFTGYPAGYPVPGFWISRISGKNSIRCIPIYNIDELPVRTELSKPLCKFTFKTVGLGTTQSVVHTQIYEAIHQLL
jgi:hypothetical protein